MAKLNKNEIEAVANKAYRALETRANEERNNAIKNYTPSDNYLAIIQLVEERDKAARIKEESEEKISKIIDKHYNLKWHSGTWGKDRYEKFIIERECSLKQIPSKESLIDDVTIAAIDRDFDTAKFIENLVAKFNS